MSPTTSRMNGRTIEINWLDEPTAPVDRVRERRRPAADRRPADGRGPANGRGLAGRRGLASGHRADSPGRSREGNRLLLLILFWAGLLTGLALWWFANPSGTIATSADALTAVGRITGMAGGYVLAVQFVLVSRVAWIEDWIGAHDLLTWHRQLGFYLLTAVLVHTATTTVGYAMTERVPVLTEAWSLFTTGEDMAEAFIATGILVAVALLAVRAARRRMSYEVWRLIHLASYGVAVLGYGHQVALGADLQSGFAGWYWLGLYLFALVCTVWGRLVEPASLNARHRLRVLSVVPESETMFSIYVGGEELAGLQARAGQYFRWRFLARGCWWESHPFSLSAAPNEQYLRLTVNVVGDHTDRLRELRPGTRVLVGGPFGTFTADRRTRPGALMIAGGSGIAPIRALLEEMPADTVLIYRASTPEDVVFHQELMAIADYRGIQVRYVVGGRDAPGPRRLLSPAGLVNLLPDVRRRDVYLCGPPGLVNGALEVLRRLRVPRRQIHLDPFEF